MSHFFTYWPKVQFYTEHHTGAFTIDCIATYLSHTLENHHQGFFFAWLSVLNFSEALGYRFLQGFPSSESQTVLCGSLVVKVLSN